LRYQGPRGPNANYAQDDDGEEKTAVLPAIQDDPGTKAPNEEEQPRKGCQLEHELEDFPQAAANVLEQRAKYVAKHDITLWPLI
jgi:hypothetical protein